MLPDQARDAITKVWADYQPGQECLKEHTETKAILDTLPPQPAPGAPPCGVPNMIDMLPYETKVGLQKIWDGYEFRSYYTDTGYYIFYPLECIRAVCVCYLGIQKLYE